MPNYAFHSLCNAIRLFIQKMAEQFKAAIELLEPLRGGEFMEAANAVQRDISSFIFELNKNFPELFGEEEIKEFLTQIGFPNGEMPDTPNEDVLRKFKQKLSLPANG
jgi:hypothetical protein